MTKVKNSKPYANEQPVAQFTSLVPRDIVSIQKCRMSVMNQYSFDIRSKKSAEKNVNICFPHRFSWFTCVEMNVRCMN